MPIYRLENPIQDYDWGSHDDMTRLFGIPNESGRPMAELWMGAHPKAPSSVLIDGEWKKLNTLTEGESLPFLFKVLSAAKPLSLQSHPNRQQALKGFARENDMGIPLDAFDRNYRDANHKPELVYALTPYRAMNGFRPLEEIAVLFDMAGLNLLQEAVELLKSTGLKAFYECLMSLEGEERELLVQQVAEFAEGCDDSAWQEVKRLNEFYPGDIGILSPLMLNVIELAPGQAMFLTAGTLHAYLQGTALEIMACSDNVLRGGLTGKHVDVEELLKTIEFDSIHFNDLLLEPGVKEDGEAIYTTPVDDFLFSIIEPTKVTAPVSVKAAEILFCIEGQQTIRCADNNTLELNPGESCFVSGRCDNYRLEGHGRLARATSVV